MSKTLGSVAKVASLGLINTKSAQGALGLGGGGDMPSTPDYAYLAQLQAQLDKQAAREQTAMNRVNQYAYGGSINWAQDANGNWYQYNNLSPEIQKSIDYQVQANQQANAGLMGRMANLNQQGSFNRPAMPRYEGSASPLTNVALPEYNPTALNIPGMPTYDPSSGKAVSDATYKLMTDRLLPQQQKDTAALTNRLRLQGLQPGTQAFDDAMRNLTTSQGDVLSGAANQATVTGYQEARDRYLAQLQGQGQQFGQNLQASEEQRNRYLAQLQGKGQQFSQNMQIYDEERQRYLTQLQAQQQDYAQQLAQYEMPWQQAAQMAQLAGGTSYSPTFGSVPTATGYSPQDVLGAGNASYNAKMGQYNSGQQKKGNTLGTGAQIATTAMMLSDERLKQNIVKLEGREALEAVLLLSGYRYEWKADGKKDMGVLAQEVKRVLPGLVDDTFKYNRVDYAGLVAVLVEAVKYLATALNEPEDEHVRHV